MSQKNAQLAGTVYFFLAGLINLVATFIWAEIRPLDILIAAACILPALIRNNTFLLTFGIMTALISAYGFIACLMFSVNPQVQTSKISFFMGFLLTGSAFLFSLLLIYAGYAGDKIKTTSLNRQMP